MHGWSSHGHMMEWSRDDLGHGVGTLGYERYIFLN